MLPQANLTSILPNVQFEGPPRNSCYSQDLHGHWPERTCRLRQGGRFHAFAQKSCTTCNFFVQKLKKYHAAAGESGRSSRQPHGWEPTA